MCKVHCKAQVVCFQMLEILFLGLENKFVENYLLLEEYVTCFCFTINLSPLLVTSKGFMPINILSDYQ